MKKTINSVTLTATAIACAFGLATAHAAHESNSFAALAGENPDAGGVAIINYVKGQDTRNGNVAVMGLTPGTYVYAVRLNDGTPQMICAFTTDSAGDGSCSDSHFDLTGFNQAVILNAGGEVVLSGAFERRGGNRVK